jgi:hypothetical protein
MIKLELRYVAHVTTLTHTVKEASDSQAATIRDLIGELEQRFQGFQAMFIQPQTGALKLNAMIYYSEPGKPPVAVIDLDHPLSDHGVVTFW